MRRRPSCVVNYGFVRRLFHFMLMGLVVLSTLLSLLSAGLWISASRGYRWSLRYAPADGRLWAARDGVRVTDRNHFSVLSVAPWPHPRLTNWTFHHHSNPAPTRINVQVGADPSITRNQKFWQYAGITFSRSEAIVALHIPTSGQGIVRRLPPTITLHPEPVRNWFAQLPYWMPTALFAALPLFWSMRWWMAYRRRRVVGRCPSCGYDLRATPDRCPECGRTNSPASEL